MLRLVLPVGGKDLYWDNLMGEMADYYNDMCDDLYDMMDQDDYEIEPPLIMTCPKCNKCPLYEYWEDGRLYMVDENMLVHTCGAAL